MNSSMTTSNKQLNPAPETLRASGSLAALGAG